jgi:DMSO reductase family type II enzyme heme b subunit
MKVANIAAGNELADPRAAAWGEIPAQAVELAPVPIAAQPNEYIRTKWANRGYGETQSASVAAASDGERLYLRLEWPDDARPNGEFQDAAAALFGSDGDAALSTMGAPASPVQLWYWEDRRPEPLAIESIGPGVFRKQATAGLDAQAGLRDGRWAVVLSGPAAAAGTKVGVAVWNGSNEERAGLAAVSRQWLPLELS